MASITLTGTLLDPTGEVAVGDQIRFTHRTTTGETIQFARSLLIIPPNGMYNFTLEFGLILVEYLDVKDVNYKNLGVVTVNGDTTATDLPALLNAIVPPTDAQLLLFQAILQDTEDARDIALAAAAQQTTLELIFSTVIHPAGTVLTLSGYTLSGAGGGAQWKLNGVVGQTPSKSPAQLGDALLNDASGNQWELVTPAGTAIPEYNPLALGADPTSTVTSHLEIKAAIQAAINKGVASVDLTGGYYLLDSAVTATVPTGIALTIRGSGKHTSGVIVNNSTGGIILTSGARDAPVVIRDFGFKARLVNSGTALEYTVPTGGNQLQRIFEAHNIFIGAEVFAGFDTGFNKGLVAEGMFRPYISNVLITTGSIATHVGAVGISVDGTFKHHIVNSYVVAGFLVGISDQGGNGEGGYISQTTVNGCVDGYIRQRTGREPEFWVIDSHFNCTSRNIVLDGVKYGWIRDNLLYAAGTAVAGFIDIQILNGDGVEIKGNTYRQPFAANRIHVDLKPTGGGIVKNIRTDDSNLQATGDSYIRLSAAVENTDCRLPTYIPDDGIYSNLVDNSSANPNQIYRGSMLTTATQGELTIDAGVITVIGSYHRVDTEADAATDDLDTINGFISDGQRIILRTANSARDVVIKHAIGNITTKTAADVTLSNTQDRIELMFDIIDGAWREI